MRFDLSRRDVLLAASGSVAGLVLSPVPWKLLDDSAIWTQRAGTAPEPLRGEVTHRFTACTLCPAGCALRARCVGAQPVSFTGVPGHPVSHGALCPTGFAAHHLPRHPLRLTGPARLVHRGRPDRNSTVKAASRTGAQTDPGDLPRLAPASLDEALAAAAGALRSARAQGAAVPLAYLDLRPGRAASLEIRRLLANLPGAVLVRPPRAAGAADATFEAMRARIDGRPGPLGADLSLARTVVGFGAPLLEGWGTPGNLRTLASRHGAGAPGKGLRLVQVEPRRSPTAEGADLWLPILPGSEAALALGLSNVLLGEGLVAPEVLRRAKDLEGDESFLWVVRRFDPDSAGRLTGIPSARIVELAREMARGPALAIGGGAPGSSPLGREAEGALAALNLLLGNGATGWPVVERRDLPAPDVEGPLAPEVEWDDLAAGSVGLLLVDSAPGDPVPWADVEARLSPASSLVVSLSPWLVALATHADWAVPGPAPLEALDEALPPAGASVASWSLAPPLLPPLPGATPPATFVGLLLSAVLTGPAAQAAPEPLEALLRRRAAAISATGRGHLFVPGEPEPVPLSAAGAADPQGLFDKLLAGAAWIDAPLPAPRQAPRFALLGSRVEEARRLARTAELGRGDPTSAEELGRAYGASGADRRPPVLEPRGYLGSSGAFPEPALLGKLHRESRLRTAPSRLSSGRPPTTVREA